MSNSNNEHMSIAHKNKYLTLKLNSILSNELELAYLDEWDKPFRHNVRN